MSRSILITGATGFIGSHLVRESLRQGFTVTAGVRSSSRTTTLRQMGVEILPIDYHNTETIRSAFGSRQWDYVIHNAGVTKVLHQEDFKRINADQTRDLMEALTDRHPQRVLLMSSMGVYGPLPQGERVFTETIGKCPNTAYGESKLMAEEHVIHSGIPYTILEPTGVYGPGDQDYLMQIKSIARGINVAIGRVPQLLSFVYVEDLARIAINALNHPNAENKYYIVAEEECYTDEQFAAIISKALGQDTPHPIRIPIPLVYIACQASEWFGKIVGQPQTLNRDKYKIMRCQNWSCDTSLIRDDLDYHDHVRLPQGIDLTVKAWQQSKSPHSCP